jgi:hypothetical protein
MLIVRKLNAYLGLLLIVIGSFCPILKVKILIGLVNWNLYSTDARLFFITFALIAFTFLCLMVRQLKAFSFLSKVTFAWVIVMALAVYFKTTHYFGKAWADTLLGKTIHFQWGWILLAIGALLLTTSTKKQQLDLNKD